MLRVRVARSPVAIILTSIIPLAPTAHAAASYASARRTTNTSKRQCNAMLATRACSRSRVYSNALSSAIARSYGSFARYVIRSCTSRCCISLLVTVLCEASHRQSQEEVRKNESKTPPVLRRYAAVYRRHQRFSQSAQHSDPAHLRCRARRER